MSVAQRRMVIKTFIFPITDYLLYLQPMTEEVGKKAKELDARCLNFILQRNVRPNQRCPGRSIATILSTIARREKHKPENIYMFKSRIMSPQPDTTDHLIWNEISTFDTVARTVRSTRPPDSLLQLPQWKEFQSSIVSARGWSGSSYFKRWIPDGRKLPPRCVQSSHHRWRER